MRKLLALLILTLALMIGGSDQAPAEKSWGVAPVVGGDNGYTQIGHEQGVPRRWAPNVGCLHADTVIELINLVNESQEKADAFLAAAGGGGWGGGLPGGVCWGAGGIGDKVKRGGGGPR